MDAAQIQPRSPTAQYDALAEALRARVSGDVRFDALSRTVYSTDASIYEMIPAGVVLPGNVDDVVATAEPRQILTERCN